MATDDIDALLVERLGYVRRNLPHRVAQVDAVLRELGYAVEETASVESPVETAARKKPIKRKRG
jgi:hypothetical protein